jgi:hypothetical protein
MAFYTMCQYANINTTFHLGCVWQREESEKREIGEREYEKREIDEK